MQRVATYWMSWLLLCAAASAQSDTVVGERIAADAIGPSVVESMRAAIDRDRLSPAPVDARVRPDNAVGEWVVAGAQLRAIAHSGSRNVLNKWGDASMSIGFPQTVDVHGVWISSPHRASATGAVRVLGYRDGALVDESAWKADLTLEPVWFELDLARVNRIEFETVATSAGGSWFAIDDLTFAPAFADSVRTVLDFEDTEPGQTLSGTSYAGLTWEFGGGDADAAVHGPMIPTDVADDGVRVEAEPSGTRAVTPWILKTFKSVRRGDAGSASYPPDSCGAIGPNHYVTVVNRNFAVYDKATGAELMNILLGSFLPGSNGDPRILFDQYSDRWVVLVTDFSADERLFLAVSLTNDPMGEWFKTSFKTNTVAPDTGRWPDYPTLGVDANGIFSASYMVGSPARMSIFVFDKAPLVADPPSLGTVTAFRDLPFEGAIQPAHHYGAAPGAYLVSTQTSTSLRIRRINPPMSAPTLTNIGAVTVPAFSDPPLAPAQGSSPGLSTVDDRLMMSVHRDGTLWTTHTISALGRAGCRWYQINPEALTLVQTGVVADPVLNYFFPSIMVNAAGDVIMGFSGSSSGQFAGAYLTGRVATDPLGEMAPPQQYKAGLSAINNIDSFGRNRWGDYSYTTLDPVDQSVFYTIQEYADTNGQWGTWVAAALVNGPDCNENGVPDQVDIATGASPDANGNGVPDECEPALPGDMNCDGAVNFGDIDAFVTALGGEAAYIAAYPNCRWLNGDTNGDSTVSFADIDPFVALLGG